MITRHGEIEEVIQPGRCTEEKAWYIEYKVLVAVPVFDIRQKTWHLPSNGAQICGTLLAIESFPKTRDEMVMELMESGEYSRCGGMA